MKPTLVLLLAAACSLLVACGDDEGARIGELVFVDPATTRSTAVLASDWAGRPLLVDLSDATARPLLDLGGVLDLGWDGARRAAHVLLDGWICTRSLADGSEPMCQPTAATRLLTSRSGTVLFEPLGQWRLLAPDGRQGEPVPAPFPFSLALGEDATLHALAIRDGRTVWLQASIAAGALRGPVAHRVEGPGPDAELAWSCAEGAPMALALHHGRLLGWRLPSADGAAPALLARGLGEGELLAVVPVGGCEQGHERLAVLLGAPPRLLVVEPGGSTAVLMTRLPFAPEGVTVPLLAVDHSRLLVATVEGVLLARIVQGPDPTRLTFDRGFDGVAIAGPLGGPIRPAPEAQASFGDR